MKEPRLYCSLLITLALALLLNQCQQTPQVRPAAMDGETIYRTDVETYYDPESTIWWDDDTFPLTMTCELRDGDGLVVASQTLTWTLPVYTGTITEPVQMMEPFSLTWALGGPLEPGLYGEWCRSEIDGHYGRSAPDVECDAANFCKANEWQAPCTWGSLWRGVGK